MHSLLESYLSEVEAQLAALPVKNRREELREMRAHLENAFIVSREIGQSEEEAAQSVVVQFGMPKDLGENVVWAWRRGTMLDRRSSFGAAVTTMLMIHLGFVARGHGLLNGIFTQTFLKHLDEYPKSGMDSTEAMIIMIFGLAGAVAGCVFPKRAVRGVWLGLWFYQVGFAVVLGVPNNDVWRFLHITLGWALSAIISASVGSRLRLMWNKRRRLVRA